MLTNQGMYLREQDRNIIIMALMYLKNDYTPEDLESLGFGNTIDKGWDEFEAVVQELIEDLVGPTWNSLETTANLKTETAKRTRGV